MEGLILQLLAKVSDRSKALLLITEYRAGQMRLAELQTLFGAMAGSEARRQGVLTQIRSHGPEHGLNPNDIARFVEQLSATPMAGIQQIPTPTLNLQQPVPGVETTQGLTTHKMTHHPGAGTIRLANTGPGKSGAPASNRHAHRVAEFNDTPDFSFTTPAQPTVSTPQPGKPLVLVADDDARIRLIFRKRLEEASFQVEEASDGNQAWEKIHDMPLTLAILDMKMPGLHGLELLARLNQEGGRLPVIVCTAYENLKNEYAINSYPRLTYLTKPVDAVKLVGEVRALIEANAEG